MLKRRPTGPYLKRRNTPCSKAQPIPHHVLHALIISHTLASPGALDEQVDDL